MVLAAKKNCQRVLAASLRVVSAMTGNPPFNREQTLRQVLFDIRAGNSNLAKSLSENSNHGMYQDENPHRCLLSLQN